MKQKNQSLLRRAVISNLLLVCTFVTGLIALYAEMQRSAMDQQLRLRAATLAEFLSVQGQFGMLISDRESLKQVAANALSVDDVLSVEWIAPDGSTLAKASRRKAQAPASTLLLTRDVSSPGTGGLIEWESSVRPQVKLGSIQVAFSTERQQRLPIRTIAFGVAAAMLCMIAVLAAQYYQLRGMLRPLRGLMEFAGLVGKGNLTQRAPVVKMDEIGRLTVAFNRMLDQLGSITVSKNYVNNILHSMAESLIVVDCDRKIRTVNQATLSMLGYREAELIGLPASSITGCGKHMHAGASSLECIYKLKDGSRIPVLFSAAELPEENGGGEVWVAQDISERKKAVEELRIAKQEAEKASQAKTELLSRTSHELRTPLNAILGFAQLLDMGELCEMDRSNLQHILKAGRHLLKLTNEVLDIAGIESGRRGLSLEAVRVREAVAESVELVGSLATERNITIEDSVRANHIVMADRQRLQQVLINLLSNAVKYNREGGQVFVECESRPDGFLRVMVRDTGKGISEEGLGKIFRPFERLDAEQAGVEGTGLGLSFAKTFMEAMGGDIGVTSSAGLGSTFWIDIPRAEIPAQPLEPPEDVPAPVNSSVTVANRLLYIEDNSSNRELVERIVNFRPGIDLTTVTSGIAGVAAARDRLPQLILLDLHLPDIWGDEVIRQLKMDPLTADIPVVMLSADATPRQIQKLLSLGAEAYLTKPIDVRELLTLLDGKLSATPVAC